MLVRIIRGVPAPDSVLCQYPPRIGRTCAVFVRGEAGGGHCAQLTILQSRGLSFNQATHQPPELYNFFIHLASALVSGQYQFIFKLLLLVTQLGLKSSWMKILLVKSGDTQCGGEAGAGDPGRILAHVQHTGHRRSAANNKIFSVSQIFPTDIYTPGILFTNAAQLKHQL